ncbi:MAG: methyltransferase domain-containing protein [Chloroflexota bacterium]
MIASPSPSNPGPGVPLRDVDWVGRWRELVQAREVQATRLRAQAGLEAPVYWDRRAEGFRANVQQREGEADRLLQLVSERAGAEATVLDVGAGVGRHALPLARVCREVVAVEPSAAMRGYLEADAAAQGLANLTVVPVAWEDAAAPVCDIALCSHVVYSIVDIEAFVEKLSRHAARYGFMAIRTAQRDAQLLELWKLVHGEEKVPEPGFLELYNVMLQRFRIAANVEITGFRRTSNPLGTFTSLDEAAAVVREQLYVAEGTPKDATAQDYLSTHLIRGDDDRLLLPGPRVGAAIVWWDNRPDSWNLLK